MSDEDAKFVQDFLTEVVALIHGGHPTSSQKTVTTVGVLMVLILGWKLGASSTPLHQMEWADAVAKAMQKKSEQSKQTH